MMFRIAAWALILFACFYGISSYPLLDNNEGMYASIARDMLVNHQFIIPRLATLPYLEKPPMLYWLMAASMSVFGAHDWACHLIPALSYFLTAAALKRFVTRISGNEYTGFGAALMMATSIPMLISGREIICDMLLTCFFSCALFEVYLWQETQKRARLLRFYGCIALAIMTKGLLALVLAGIVVMAYYVLERKPFAHYLRTLSPLGILLFFAMTAPWHIMASLQQEGFAWFYFINEHVMRFINKREPHDYHTGPWWYYLPRILAYVVPWTFFLLIFQRKLRIYSPPLEGGVRGGVLPCIPPHPTLPLKGGGESAKRFLWSWFFVCLLFFSSAGSKANYYMILGMPALIAMVTLQLQAAINSGSRVARSLTSGSFMLLLVVFGFVRSFCATDGDFLEAACSNIPEAYLIGVASYGVASIILSWRLPQKWLMPLLGSSIVILLPILIALAGDNSDLISQKSAAGYLQVHTSPNAAIYQDFEEVSALSFYLNKPLVIVDSHSNDLLYGQKSNANPTMFMTLKEWAGHTPYVPMVVLKSKLFGLMDTLQNEKVDLRHVCIIERFSRVIIVSMCVHGH